MATMSWDAVTGSRCINLTITKMSTGDRDLRVTFTDGSGDTSKTDHYTIYWEVKRGGVWREGDTNDITWDITLDDFYTPPDDTTEVRVRIKAVAKTYKDSKNNEYYYYEENPSSYTYYKFNGDKPGLSTYSVDDVTLRLQSGSETGLYAIWSWSRESQTDHFETIWDYSTSLSGNVWYDPSSSNLDPSTRQANYNIPANARRVRFRIRPLAKKHIETYSGGQYNTKYWYGAWTTYYWVIAGTVTPTTKRSISPVTLRIQSGTDSSLYASWSWSYASQTDHFETIWDYSTSLSGNVWYDPSSSNPDASTRQANYNIPDNARRVRFRIRPVSKVYSETYKEGTNTFGTRTTSYWAGEWTTYYWIEAGTVTPTVHRKVKTISIGLERGTDSTIYTMWSWDYQSQTNHFEIDWDYSTKDNGTSWFEGPNPSNLEPNIRQTTYNMPSNAKRVRFRIRPIANTTTETYTEGSNVFGRRTSQYWIGDWSEYYYYQNGGYVAPTTSKKVESITLGLQTGSDLTIFAKWDWAFENETEKFQIAWKYDSGDGVWFEGSSSEVGASVRQTLYNMPSNAKRVRFAILPVGKRYTTTTSSGNTSGRYETSYWYGQWSEPRLYSVGGYVAPTSKNKVNYISVDLVNGTDRDLFATWEWKATKQTDHFEVVWEYDTGNTVWFNGSSTEVDADVLVSTYGVPSNAKRVRVKILPVSKEYSTRNSSGTYTTAYWVGQWSSYVYYNFVDAKTPATPSVPNVTIDQYTLTAELDSYDVNTQYIEFEVVKNDKKTVNSGQSKVVTNHAAFSCKVDVGGQYKVRARGLLPVSKTPKVTNQVKTTVGNCEAGEWSEYSSNVTTVPAAPSKIKSHKVENETSVWLYWDTVSSATGYTIEYAKDKMFFDSSTEAQSQSINTNSGQMFISGLDTGTTWFFRLQATNEQGSSGWTPVYSIILGVKPAPPTTWSETSTVIVGEDAVLYWMHNSEDGSSQREADISVKVNGTEVHVTPTKMSTDGTASYAVVPTRTTTSNNLADRNGAEIYIRRSDDTTYDGWFLTITSVDNFAAGSVIQWKVRTKGVLDEWSDWSVVRTIMVYEQPVVELTVSDRSDLSTYIYTLQKYPFYVNGVAYPDTQDVVGWNCSIIANNAYESRNQNGTTRYIKEGEEIFSKYYSDTSKNLTIEFRPEDVDLENNITYTVIMSVVMNSGLSGESSKSFTVNWEYTDLEPNAEVSIDPELLTAYILPYCRDTNGDPIPNILLSVYRREYDGRFVEIASGIDNSRSITVTDPHPALDYARYRIVAQSTDTGLVDYYDLPGVPVGETAIIIQWDEDWSNYNYTNGNAFDPLSEPVHTGSMLRLPYNINVSDNYGMDVSLVEYIGRSHPVSYYGTQLGVTSNWSSDIPRDDAETLYALRRLAIYQGDAYVREPSGSGYWAQVVPSFNKSYDSMTIPVTLDITRVEGGV